MGRGLPDPPPQAPPEKPAEPYKTLILNGPTGAPVQSCKWSETTSSIYLKLLQNFVLHLDHYYHFFFQTSMKTCSVFSALSHSAVPKPRKGI